VDNEEVPSIDVLKRKLERVSVLDRELQVFGAYKHKYESHLLSEAELADLEGELGVRLPADYRQFLQVIGYGAGPYYGLYGPEEMLSAMRDEYFWDQYRQPAPSRPFPFGREQAEECWRIMDERREAVFQTEGPADGCIPICYEGCTFWSVLVTAGDLAGCVWSWKSWSVGDYYYNLAPLPPGVIKVERLNLSPSYLCAMVCCVARPMLIDARSGAIGAAFLQHFPEDR
jgi:hypothetical protein